jgi:Flp pilus assembly protein TadG
MKRISFPVSHATPRPRLSGDEGAILAEFALVLPLLVTLLMSVFEGGVWFLNSNRLNGSVQLAARTIASQGKERMSDNAGLLALRAASPSFSSTIQIQYVIVYNAKIPDAQGRAKPSAACLAKANALALVWDVNTTGDGLSTADAQCNIYTWRQIQDATPSDTPGFTSLPSTPPATPVCSASAWDRHFCPTGRHDALSNLVTPLDYIGVWVGGTYTSASKMLFRSATVTDYAVYRVEPAPGS